MRITWHGHESALHFLLMDQPVLSRREVSPGVVELLDSDRRLVRVDALDLPGISDAAYHAEEDWLDVHVRAGEFQRLVHVVPKLVISVGSDDEVLRIQLLDARRGGHVPLEDIALLIVEAAAAGGRAEAALEVPKGMEPGEYRRTVDLMASRGWRASAGAHAGPQEDDPGALPRAVTFTLQR